MKLGSLKKLSPKKTVAQMALLVNSSSSVFKKSLYSIISPLNILKIQAGCFWNLLSQQRKKPSCFKESSICALSRDWLFEIPRTAAQEAPLSMGFPRKECWSGLPFPFPGIFPTQGSNLSRPHCSQILYYLSHQGTPYLLLNFSPTNFSNY